MASTAAFKRGSEMKASRVVTWVLIFVWMVLFAEIGLQVVFCAYYRWPEYVAPVFPALIPLCALWAVVLTIWQARVLGWILRHFKRTSVPDSDDSHEGD